MQGIRDGRVEFEDILVQGGEAHVSSEWIVSEVSGMGSSLETIK